MDAVLRVVQPVVQPAGETALDSSERFDDLFHAHYQRVVGVLCRLMGDRAQAEEIAADAFCKLARKPGGEDREGRTSWLYRVAINAGLDAVRSNTRRKRREEAVAGSPQSTEDALDRLLAEERRERVQRVLAALKPRDAQLLLLRSDGMAYRDLSLALGIRLNSVGSILARAEQQFERKYRARYGGQI
jgi:RNA polymerase sigma-70 factor (ECF subfamily)